MSDALTVEWCWVPVSESENAERCQRLRELLLRAAQRLSQSACLAQRPEASVCNVPPRSNFPAVLPSTMGNELTMTGTNTMKGKLV
jgi:hypothetical protein